MLHDFEETWINNSFTSESLKEMKEVTLHSDTRIRSLEAEDAQTDSTPGTKEPVSEDINTPDHPKSAQNHSETNTQYAGEEPKKKRKDIRETKAVTYIRSLSLEYRKAAVKCISERFCPLCNCELDMPDATKEKVVTRKMFSLAVKHLRMVHSGPNGLAKES